MDAAVVDAALVSRLRWRVLHVRETRSTNDDLARGSGTDPHVGDGTVLITELQTAGRGRSGRAWSCPPGAGLMFSMKMAMTGIPLQRRAWVGAALGVAIVDAFRMVTGVRAGLKWPNDVLIDGGKCGGILAESVGDSVVVGAGLNISLERDELPRPDATSLLLAGAGPVDRNLLLAVILDEFGDVIQTWRAASGDVDRGGLRARYLAHCVTLGVAVAVELPGGRKATGLAVDVDPDGAIVLDQGDGRRTHYSAGDVVHLRPSVAPAADTG